MHKQLYKNHEALIAQNKNLVKATTGLGLESYSRSVFSQMKHKCFNFIKLISLLNWSLLILRALARE